MIDREMQSDTAMIPLIGGDMPVEHCSKLIFPPGKSLLGTAFELVDRPWQLFVIPRNNMAWLLGGAGRHLGPNGLGSSRLRCETRVARCS